MSLTYGRAPANIWQKVRSTAYTSFNVLGLFLTLGIGALIIILAYTIEPLLHFIQLRRKKGLYERLEWVTNETLQMQRLVHEELGAGTWSRATEDIPITAPGELLAVLDVSDENHPIFKYNPKAPETSTVEHSRGLKDHREERSKQLLPTITVHPVSPSVSSLSPTSGSVNFDAPIGSAVPLIRHDYEEEHPTRR